MNRIILFILLFFCFSKSVSQNKKTTSLGIPNFTVLGNPEDVEKYKWLEIGFSESLTDAFSRVPEFSLIERNQFLKIINEQNLQNTKQIDTSSIVKAGKILGVKQILIGSCQIITGHTLVNMRIVNVETGEISPLKNLPTIVTTIDSVLFLQKKLCLEVMKQFNVKNENEIISQIETVTSGSTINIKAYEFLNKGLELFNNGQFNDAIEMYNNALTIDKKYQKAYYRRGESKIKINNYDEGIEDYKKVDNYIRKDSVFSLIGDAYMKQGDKEKSVEYLVKAQKINPGNLYVKRLLNEINQNEFILNNKQVKSSSTDFETIYQYNNGIARVKKNKKYGYIDINGSIKIPLIYDDLRDFKNGFAAAKLDSKWGFIDEKGILVLEAKYSEVSDFDEYKLARVVNKDKWGMINSKGKIIIPIEFLDNILYGYWKSEDLMVVTKTNGLLNLNYSDGVYDREGNIIIPTIYDDIYIIRITDENYKTIRHEIYASLNSKWGMINTKNETIIPFVYESRDCIRSFKNGFAAVKVNERWGFVNTKGIRVIDTFFEIVNDFNGKMFEVRDKGKWGLIYLDFKQTLPCEYEKVEYNSNGYYKLLKGGKLGILGLDFVMNLPCEYEKIEKVEYDGKGYYKIKKEDKWGIVDLNFKQILDCEYENIEFLSKSYLKVKKDGKMGVVDINNKLVLAFEYENIQYLTYQFLGVQKNNKWGIIDNKNNTICDFKYDKINHSFNIDKNKDTLYFEVLMNGKRIWIDSKCKCIFRL